MRARLFTLELAAWRRSRALQIDTAAKRTGSYIEHHRARQMIRDTIVMVRSIHGTPKVRLP